MQEDFWPAIQLADSLGQFTGYLDTVGLNARNEVNGKYKREIANLSHRIINETGSSDAAKQSATESLANLASANPEWDVKITEVNENLLAQIDADGKISLLRRRIRYYSLPIFTAVIVAIYLGVWWFNIIAIDQPVNTVKGLRQRAMAVGKVIDYDRDMSGPFRRGGWVRDIVMSAFEPNEKEVAAAQEFVYAVQVANASTPPAERACHLGEAESGQVDQAAATKYIEAISEKLLEQPTDVAPSAALALKAAIKSVPGCGESWRDP